MIRKNQLAIVIPAYKARFFREALESIANQTDKDFHLYIGDDNSSENLEAIVNEFEDRINMTYVKFNENVGGENLIAQWERCISLTNNEEWIWLFSDDDVMDPNCVEEFFKNVSDNNYPLLYHFNVDVINSNGEISEAKRYFPDELNAVDFLLGKIKARYRSYVVEYIFNRKAFTEVGGFPNFDLAWNSDDAMWFQLAEKSSIKTIPKAKVYWRASEVNLSRFKNNAIITVRKLKADLSFLNWLNIRTEKNIRSLRRGLIIWFFNRLELAKGVIDRDQYYEIRTEYHNNVASRITTLHYWCYIRFKNSRIFHKIEMIKKKIFPSRWI
ncbi:glycosyltransferase [Saccharicrinis sp. FJH62]|uniref:glycosyltransferase n=1 Tax=Saccharicrinis sp. FJH62 TaxID=3344657 RepID=UPI0035D49224